MANHAVVIDTLLIKIVEEIVENYELFIKISKKYLKVGSYLNVNLNYEKFFYLTSTKYTIISQEMEQKYDFKDELEKRLFIYFILLYQSLDSKPFGSSKIFELIQHFKIEKFYIKEDKQSWHCSKYIVEGEYDPTIGSCNHWQCITELYQHDFFEVENFRAWYNYDCREYIKGRYLYKCFEHIWKWYWNSSINIFEMVFGADFCTFEYLTGKKITNVKQMDQLLLDEYQYFGSEGERGFIFAYENG